VKAHDLRELTEQELRQRLADQRKSLWMFRKQLTTGAVENVRAARTTRREIARMKMILRERELTAQKEATK